MCKVVKDGDVSGFFSGYGEEAFLENIKNVRIVRLLMGVGNVPFTLNLSKM